MGNAHNVWMKNIGYCRLDMPERIKQDHFTAKLSAKIFYISGPVGGACVDTQSLAKIQHQIHFSMLVITFIDVLYKNTNKSKRCLRHFMSCPCIDY